MVNLKIEILVHAQRPTILQATILSQKEINPSTYFRIQD